MSSPKVIFAAGGTGGHLFPAVSLAEHLNTLGYETILVTDERGIKYYKEGTFKHVLIRHVKRYSKLLKRLSYPLSFAFQLLRCLKDIITIKPSIIIGFGGYPSVPITLAGILLRTPIIIHEQNVNLGKANRLLARFAKKVCLSFDSPTNIPNSTVVGGLIRSNITKLGNITYKLPADNENFCILVIGGSQGSNVVTKNVALAIQQLPEDIQKKLSVIQQCRDELKTEIQQIYSSTFVDVKIEAFFSNIEQCLSQAHLVICRSGASTIAELAFCGKPAIFIPFAGAIESDQFFNAQQVVNAQAGWMITEDQLTPQHLTSLIQNVLTNPQDLQTKASLIKTLWKPDVYDNLAKIVAETGKNLLPI